MDKHSVAYRHPNAKVERNIELGKLTLKLQKKLNITFSEASTKALFMLRDKTGNLDYYGITPATAERKARDYAKKLDKLKNSKK